jgi:hypothetical protein
MEDSDEGGSSHLWGESDVGDPFWLAGESQEPDDLLEKDAEQLGNDEASVPPSSGWLSVVPP